jgi:nitrogen fixation/metabolism regulation signal transduction histidine kinase
MVYKWFYGRLLLRLILMIAVTFLSSYFVLKTENNVTSLALVLFLFLLILEFLRFTRRGVSDLDKLILSLMNEDFALSFPQNLKGNHMREIHEKLNRISLKFKELKIQKENHFRLLETIIESLNTGMMVIQTDGRVVLMNSAARELLRIPPISDRKILRERLPQFFGRLEQISLGQQVLLNRKTATGKENLVCYRGKMILHGVELDFYTIQNIRREMEGREIESYQRLIRILTHEIMNSITPIASLSESMVQLASIGQKEWSEENHEDLQLGLETIHRRTEGLYRFVQDYRKMSQVPEPVLQEADLGDLAERLYKLYKASFDEKGIELKLDISRQNHNCRFDPELIEQAGVNLVKNAGEACMNSENPVVVIEVKNSLGEHQLRITDNGPGIPEDKREKILVPFYSTKSTGSGIGLSLSNYIINKHKSKLNFESSPQGTSFWFEL